MEVGVRLVGILLRILNFLLSPIFWLNSGRHRCVPPLQNHILLLGAKELAEKIRSGEHTSEEIVSTYIERVKEVNPYINAVADERYHAALDDARTIDRQIADARSKGTFEALVKEKPLLGVPFTVKESCSLAGLSDSVGCLELAGRRARADGAGVRRVRGAGAVPLLVSCTPELCLGWETGSRLRGRTRHPRALARSAGGSSGGEAALLAAGASAFSVASDIAGSIRLPAAFCGVFGHKPTPGVVPVEGHVPSLADPQFARLLAVGPMARTADDLSLLMDVMAGGSGGRLRLDQPVRMDRLKVLYMTEATRSLALIPVDPRVARAVTSAVQYLATCGASVSEEKFKELEDSVEISISVFFSMKDIPNLLQDPANPKRDKSLVVELAKCVVGGASRSLQGLGFSLIHRTRLFVPAHRVAHYCRRARALREHMTKVLGDNGVFIYPVFNELAHYHNQVFLKASGVMYTMVFNILGMPCASVPLGTTGGSTGLPIAVQVIAAPNQDRLCLAVAKQLEIGFGGWQPPQ